MTQDKHGKTAPYAASITVFLLTLVFFFNFLGRLTLAPFMVQLENEFNISHSQAGQLFLIISFGYGTALFLSGFVAGKLLHRGTVILSSGIMGITLILLYFTPSLAWLKILLFFLGFTGGLYLPSGITIITSVLSAKHWGKGLAVHEIAPNASFVLAPAIAAAVEGLFTWREVFLLIGIGSILTAPAFARFGKGGNFPGRAPNPENILSMLKTGKLWILAGLFTLGVSITFGSFSMLPLYLVTEHGLSKAWANQLVSFSRIPCFFVALGAGILIDRIGTKPTIVLALSTAGILTLTMGILENRLLQIAVILQPLLAVTFFPAGFAGLSQIFDSDCRSLAVSLIIPLAFIFGTGFIPTGLGWFGDHGMFRLAFIIHGLIILSCMNLVFLISFNRANKKSPAHSRIE